MQYVDLPPRIKNAIESGDVFELLRPVSVFFAEDGWPIKCPYCGSDHIKGMAKVRVRNKALCIDYICQECNNFLIEWIGGYLNQHDINYIQNYIEDCIDFYNDIKE